jgi:hypothetical protein
MNIEQAQALSLMEHYAKEFLKGNETMCISIDIAKSLIKKDLEVLEIIKKKRVNVGLVAICETYKDYCRWFVEEHKGMQPLTETEFNLIKEWLNYDK